MRSRIARDCAHPMTRRPIDDRRDAPVAAVTPGPVSGSRFPSASGHVELPAVLVRALEATGTSIERFLDRLRQGSIWQDEAIRSADREIEIQAYLPADGLRCVVRIGRSIYYHHPLRTFHVYGMLLPAIDVGDGISLGSILPHALLDTIPIVATGITSLNSHKADIGVCIRVTMPSTNVEIPIHHG